MITLFGSHHALTTLSFDPYSSYVTYSAPFTGTNGSAVFTDLTGRSNVTAVGSPVISTTENSAGSLYLNGSSALELSSTASTFSFGSSDFTIEFSVYMTSLTGIPQFVSSEASPSLNSFSVYYDSSANLCFDSFGPSYATSTFAWSPSINTWYQIAIVRKGSNLYAFVNGTQIGSTVTGFSPTLVSVTTLQIGFWEHGNSDYVSGYMNNVRITNGFGRYTSNYTPTAFLPLVMGYYTSGFSTSNYISISSVPAVAFGTSGNFTIEGWINPTTLSGSFQAIITSGGLNNGPAGSWEVGIQPGNHGLALWNNSPVVYTGSTTGLTVNTWAHIAFVRNSGTMTLYVNGVSKSSVSDTSNYSYTGPVTSGYDGAGGGAFSGSMSNFRVSNTAIYTSNFTPPTTALTSSSSTILLLYQTANQSDGSSNKYTVTTNGSLVITPTSLTYL